MLTTTSTSTTTMTHCRHRRCPHHLGLHWVCPTWLAVHHLHANKHTRARTHMHTQDAYNIDKAVLTRARTHTQTHTCNVSVVLWPHPVQLDTHTRPRRQCRTPRGVGNSLPASHSPWLLLRSVWTTPGPGCCRTAGTWRRWTAWRGEGGAGAAPWVGLQCVAGPRMVRTRARAGGDAVGVWAVLCSGLMVNRVLERYPGCG